MNTRAHYHNLSSVCPFLLPIVSGSPLPYLLAHNTFSSHITSYCQHKFIIVGQFLEYFILYILPFISYISYCYLYIFAYKNNLGGAGTSTVRKALGLQEGDLGLIPGTVIPGALLGVISVYRVRSKP